MSVIDLHPEELLERDVRGELSAAERARLESHLARCATCRFERRARADFAEELALSAGDALSPEAQIIAMALGKTGDLTAGGPRPPPWRKRARVWALAVAALFVGGIAGAGIHTWTKRTAAVESGDMRPPEQPPSTAPARPVAPLRRSVEPRPMAEAKAAPPAEPIAEPSAESVVADAVTKQAPSPLPAPAGTAATRPARDPAAVLFDQASDAERRGDHARALDLFRELQSRYPQTREAHVSYATMGQLLLDRGDANGALASADAYTSRGHDQLDEAAMVGRARALERLGRVEEERAAWRALLAAFPATPYAGYARARLR